MVEVDWLIRFGYEDVKYRPKNEVATRMHLANNDFVMSVSTYERGQAWPEIRLLPDVLIGVDGPQPPARVVTQSISKVPDVLIGVDGPPQASDLRTKYPATLNGRLEIPGAGFTIPEQGFSSRPTEAGLVLESHPERPWPKILIELQSTLPQSKVERLLVQASDDTVSAELLRTRVVFAIAMATEWFLHIDHLVAKVEHQHGRYTEANEKQIRYKAKIFRKLKYIEETFGLCFSVPETISSDEVQRIETMFRGITEGEFRGRANAMSFKLLPSMIDLSKPPFSGVGEFSYEVGAPIKLFDQQVPAGRFTVHLEKAELANPRVVQHIRKGSREPIEVRFEVLDNQVVYRFEDYMRQPRQHLRQRLDQFKEELALEEPRELVDLVDQHIQDDVSGREATQIAVGWTFYSHLPDRYCPQEPEIDDTTGHWRVPIWLVYASGEGGPVGEVMIDKKTGEIVRHTPIDELRGKGLALAEKILNA